MKTFNSRVAGVVMSALLAVAVAPLVSTGSDAVAAPAGSGTGLSQSAGPTPILVVFDLSSSMTEDDGSGTVKLDGAKTSLIDLVSKQPPSTEIGLWTYPASTASTTDSCAAGGYVAGADLQPIGDPANLSATIRGLQANGDTPTGDALKSAAESLRDRGRSSATILLVSDGESNCGAEPCDVAKSLVAEGFDITVQAMGFRISDSGRNELECIADATQGAYYDISDSEQLTEKLSSLSVPALDVAVSAPQSAASGGTTQLTATVRNLSAVTIDNSEVGLQFQSGTDRQGLLPAVIPPRFRLGRLEPNAEATRSWTVSTGPANAAGALNWSVGAWGDTTLPARQRGTIVLSDGLVASQGGSVLKDIVASSKSAIIMGDSFSSGEGTKSYLPADAVHADTCHRSNSQYASQLLASAKNPQVRNIACSGAIMSDLISPQVNGRGGFKATNGQLQQLKSQDAASAAFLTLGGNDIGFGAIAQSCITGDCTTDKQLKETVAEGMQSLDRLGPLYTDIFRVANSKDKLSRRKGQVAPVIVLPYPRIVPPTERASCADLSRGEVGLLNATIDALNLKVKSQVKQSFAGGSEIYYVDSVVNAMMPDHTMCDAVPYANPVSILRAAGPGLLDAAGGKLDLGDAQKLAEFAHPNVAGHRAMASAIVSWSTTITQRPTYRDIPGTRLHLDSRGVGEPDKRVDLSKVADTVSTTTSGVLSLVAPNSLALSWVKVFLHSQPQMVATVRSDAAGRATMLVTVPSDLTAGRHHLTISGTSPDGQPFSRTVELIVSKPLPWWVWFATGVTVSLLVAGAATLFVARRRNAR